jgi:pyruvate kinase
MRFTKIIATLGPASATERVVADLVSAGVDVFRLNFSHGTREEHRRLCALVREAARRAGRVVAVMQDLSGPKIRTGPLAGEPFALAEGDTLRIALGDFAGGPGRVSTTSAALVRGVRPGGRLLLDDGRIELAVKAVDGDEIAAEVTSGGRLGAHKGNNAPGVELAASAPTDQDVDDLRFGLTLGVDLVALSFVQAAADLAKIRDAMAGAGHAVPVVAKIERPKAVERIDEIVQACDAVMVARGDLGLEMPLEQVPRIQKEITRRARALGRPVIVATQVLESMTVEPRPTRAEVSDAAHAVDSGADAIMLAGETAVGAHPVRAVRTLAAIIDDAERDAPTGQAPFGRGQGSGHGRALAESAIVLAAASGAGALVAVTRGGKTARLLAALRPVVPVFAATDSPGIASELALYRGVVPVVAEVGPEADVERQLVERGLIAHGTVVVFVNVHPDLTRPEANFVNLLRLA